MTAEITPITQAGSLSDHAKRYGALGWFVIPLWWIDPQGKGRNGCMCGNAECKSPGKHPIGQIAGRGQHSATTDANRIRTWWTEYPKANIGIYLQQSGLCAVDIDPRNGGIETIDDLESQNGPIVSDVLAFTGGGGEHRIFEAPANLSLPGKLGPGVDLKLDGYVVVEPSNHESGGSYQWEASSDPLEGAVASPLPPWIRDIGRQHQQPVGAAKASAGGGPMKRELYGDELQRLLDALGLIDSDPRDNWLTVGMALSRDLVAAQGMDIWESWSGQSGKFDIDDQVKTWYSFRRNSLDDSVGLGTIFEMAGTVGKTIAAMKPIEPVSMIGGYSIEELDEATRQSQSVVSEAPLVPYRPFPVAGLNELTAWICANNDTTHPLANQAIALSIACLAASRRYESPFGDPAHCSFGVIMPSASMGRYLSSVIEAVVSDAGMRRMIKTTRFTSPQMLYGSLFRSPSLMYCAGDWTDQLRFARRQSSGLLEQVHAIIGERINPGSDILLDTWAELGIKANMIQQKTNPAIYSPSMTMMAPLPASQLSHVFHSAELARGAVDSMIFVPTDDSAWITRPSARPLPPLDAVRDRFRQLRGLEPGVEIFNPEDLLSALALQRPTPITVRFNADLQRAELEIIQRANSVSPAARTMLHGARRNIRRLCVAMAAWGNPHEPVVSKEIFDWCHSFVMSCVNLAIAEWETTAVDEGAKPDAYEFLGSAVARAGAAGIKKSDLPRVCKGFRRLDREAREKLLDQMITDGQVSLVPTPDRRGHRLVHFRFMKSGIEPSTASTIPRPGVVEGESRTGTGSPSDPSTLDL